MGKICAVMNNKGGCLKSTLSIMTTLILREEGYRVLFIDTDDQRNSSNFFEADMGEGSATLADILYGDMPAAECIQHVKYADIIASDKELKDAETRTGFDEMRFFHLRDSLMPVSEDYDFVIIDTPPALNVITRNVLACPGVNVVIPIMESGWSITGLMDLYDAVMMAKRTTNPGINVLGLVTVMSQKNTNASGRIDDNARQLCEKMGTSMFDTKIRGSVKIGEAITEYGISPIEYAPKCKPVSDYREYVKEFLCRMGVTK